MKILIIEDEPKTALMLKGFIEWHHTYTVAAICDSIETSVQYLREHQHELSVIFMDIELSDGQSFEIFDKIAIHLPVVFCTSYNEYMLKAFKNQGIDYILKPFDAIDIRQTIAKVESLKERFSTQPFVTSLIKSALVEAEKPAYQSNFLIRLREKIYPVLVADIAFVCIENEIVYLYTLKGEKHAIFKSMDDIENAISPQHFYRISRQVIINRKAIKEIEPYFNQRMIVHLSVAAHDQILVPRLKVTPFLSWVENG